MNVFFLLLQLLSENQVNVMNVVNSVRDALDSIQKGHSSVKGLLKADLQSVPVDSNVWPIGCSSGDGKDTFLHGFFFLCKL